MIELPSAVEVAEELATEADFLCVGTNDLIQYILAVDRTNESIADYYVPHHPAVLRSLKRVAVAGQAHGTPVSLCGDMASDPAMIPFLIGIGIERLSMDIRRIPTVQQVVTGIDAAEAARQADIMLGIGRISELSAFLAEGART